MEEGQKFWRYVCAHVSVCVCMRVDRKGALPRVTHFSLSVLRATDIDLTAESYERFLKRVLYSGEYFCFWCLVVH